MSKFDWLKDSDDPYIAQMQTVARPILIIAATFLVLFLTLSFCQSTNQEELVQIEVDTTVSQLVTSDSVDAN